MLDWTVDEMEIAKRAVVQHRIKEWVDRIGGGKFPIYAAQQNSDLTEGKGHYIPKGYFPIPELAYEANDLLCGVQGTQNTAPINIIVVYNSIEEWKKDNPMLDLR